MSTTFIYRGWDRAGRVIRGSIRAETANDASRMVGERGIRQIGPVALAGATFRIKNWFVGKPVQRISFFRSLASLMEAGVSPTNAFTLLAEQIGAEIKAKTNKYLPFLQAPARRFLATVNGMHEELINGSKISATMGRRPDDFTDVEVAMVAAGEKAGSQVHVVSTLASYLEQDRKFNKSVKSALTYPIVVSGAAFLLVIGLGIFIVPKFVDLYAGFDVPLPITMRVMLMFSHALQSPLFDISLIFGTIIAIFLATRSLETPAGALAFDRARLKVPVVGELIRKNIMISVANVLQMLTDAGENPAAALDIMTQITNSPVYAKALVDARDSLMEGRCAAIYDALDQTTVFEPFFLGYVRIGRESGKLGEMLQKVSEHYKDDVAALVAQIPVIVQTVMIIFLGLVVGSIVISVFEAITSLATGIK